MKSNELSQARKSELIADFKKRIVADFKNGLSYEYIAFKYGISQSEVLNIVERAKR